MALVKNN